MHRRHVTYPQGREATQYRPKGIMIKSIAWATDGSPSARRAFTVAKELARAHESRLLILHVQETGITRARLLADVNDHVPVSLERVVEQLRAEGIDAELAVGEASDGAAHRTILDLAEEADVDLIIVGNRGHGATCRPHARQCRATATSGRAIPGVAGSFVPRHPHHHRTQKWVLIPMAPQSPRTASST